MAATPLHLTDENKDQLRALVRQITPDYEERLWADVYARRSELERLQQQMRDWTRAALRGPNARTGPNSVPVAVSTTSGMTPILTTGGTGFSFYPPRAPGR